MFELLDTQKKYIIGVSGGCDSMALLDMLVKNNYQVIIAHVNYNLRNDTEEDYKVVHDYALLHNVPFEYKEVTSNEYKEGNFQSVARDIRYDFYKELYDHYHADGLLLAHHKDDVLETIYMHLERKSITSYLGIKEKTVIKDMTVIRPLLSLHKQDLRDYCINNHIAFHDDYTNFETHFTRDRIRNTVLNTYSEEEKEALLNKANEINKKQALLEEKAQEYIVQYNKNNSIDYTIILPELMDTFLYLLLNEYVEVSGSLIDEVKHQIKSNKPNIQMNLSVNYLFIKEYHNINIHEVSEYKDYEYVFDHKEAFNCEYFKVSFKGDMNAGIPISEDEFPITIRNSRPGDIIETVGGSKKVSRLFINNKIPASKRKTWPIVVNKNNQILLIPYIAKRKGYLATNPNYFVIK